MDIHESLHGRDTPREDCPMCLVIAEHHERWEALIALYESPYAIPKNERDGLQEETRRKYMILASGVSDDSHGAATRRDKTVKMLAFVHTHPGLFVTAATLAHEVGAAPGTGYGFIREHRHLFHQVPDGFTIIDVVAERAAAKLLTDKGDHDESRQAVLNTTPVAPMPPPPPLPTRPRTYGTPGKA